MINVMKKAAIEAGNILLSYYKKNPKLNYKTSHKDFYTIADVESQKSITEIITKLLVKKGIKESEIGFIGEEKLHVDSKRKHLFVIDPRGNIVYDGAIDNSPLGTTAERQQPVNYVDSVQFQLLIF